MRSVGTCGRHFIIMKDLFVPIILNFPWVYLLVEFLHYNKKENQSLKRPVIETIFSLVIYALVYAFTDYKKDIIFDVVFVVVLFVGFVVVKRIRKKSVEE